MENIKIVDYKPSYAAAVADMWRKSAKGWLGTRANETEESVLRAHESNKDINTYLALLGDEVVGYCGVSKFQHDKNSLYIRTLNVRYDFHRKGIGKTLVLNTIKRAKELGYSKVDLYTWPGNTQSIPLYKRCGFFYQKDFPHLMNFMPEVLTTEAFQDYFEKIDWYKNLNKTIDIEPDGIEENNFIFYEYLWEKEDTLLRIQFEHKSRGIRLIETNDYLIKASLHNENLVFGKSYNIKYEIINKSKKPLDICIKGKSNKIIDFLTNKTLSVTNKEVLQEEFFVHEYKEKLGIFDTYPSVVSKILINGKEVEFKIGLRPQCPAEISLEIPNNQCYKNMPSTMYLDIKNNYEEDATFEFNLPENENIKILNKNIRVPMKPYERQSLKIEYILNNFTFYNELLKVNIQLDNGKTFTFEKKLGIPFKGTEGTFGGKGEDYYIITNGPYSLKFNSNNSLIIETLNENSVINHLTFPMLGKPFSQEFSNKKPEAIKHYKEDDKIVMNVTFVSEAFKDIRIEFIIKLSQSGIIEHYYEIYNDNEAMSFDDLTLCENTSFPLKNSILPYKNKFIYITDSKELKMESIDCDKLTENWIFSRTAHKKIGFHWHKDLQPKTFEEYLSFEHKLGRLAPKKSVATKPIYMTLNTFKDWKTFRSFALGSKTDENLILQNEFGIVVNENNPFVKDNFTITLQQDLEKPLFGNYSIKSANNSFYEINENFNSEDRVSERNYNITLDRNINKDILILEADSYVTHSQEKKVVFKVNDNLCERKIIEEEGHKVYSFNNGIVEIKSSPTFAPNLYSLKYNNHEYLESSFPTPRPKSWFYPWLGGIVARLKTQDFKSLLGEDTISEFITLEDNFKNKWQGIKVTVNIRKNDKYKGIDIDQYFLLLPGSPVLCYVTSITQNTGHFLNNEHLNTFSFFNLDDDIKNNWLTFRNEKGTICKHKVGVSSEIINSSSSVLYGNNLLADKMQVYLTHSKEKYSCYISTEDNGLLIDKHVTLENGASKFTSPQFYIFTEDYIENELLKDLRNIRFE